MCCCVQLVLCKQVHYFKPQSFTTFTSPLCLLFSLPTCMNELSSVFSCFPSTLLSFLASPPLTTVSLTAYSIPIPVFILHALYPSCFPSHSGDQKLGADVAAPACAASVYQWVDRHARKLLSTASTPWRLAHLADTEPLF